MHAYLSDQQTKDTAELMADITLHYILTVLCFMHGCFCPYGHALPSIVLDKMHLLLCDLGYCFCDFCSLM